MDASQLNQFRMKHGVFLTVDGGSKVEPFLIGVTVIVIHCKVGHNNYRARKEWNLIYLNLTNCEI